MTPFAAFFCIFAVGVSGREEPSLRDEIVQIVFRGRVAEGACLVRPVVRVAVDARDAEMLEGVARHADGAAVIEREGLRADAAFGDHGHGGDEAELFVDAGAQVGVPERVEHGRVRPFLRVLALGVGGEDGVEGGLQAALSGEVEGEEDEEEG